MKTNPLSSFLAVALGVALTAPGGVTFDYEAASKRLFGSAAADAGGNLLKTEDSAWRPECRVLRGGYDRAFDVEAARHVEISYADGEGLLVVKPSVRSLFKVKDHAESVTANLCQEVRLPDAEGGVYRFSFQFQSVREGGLMAGAFLVPFRSKDRARLDPYGVGPFRDVRAKVPNFTDTEWFDHVQTVVLPKGCDAVLVIMRTYSVGTLRFRNVALVKSKPGPEVVLVQASQGLVDPSFAVGEGQAGLIGWQWRRRADVKPASCGSVVFRLRLPKGFTFLSATFADVKTIAREAQPDGSTLVTFHPQCQAMPATTFNSRRLHLALVRADGPVGTEGWGSLQAFGTDGRPFSTEAKTRYFTVPAVRAKAVPTCYMNGMISIVEPKLAPADGVEAFVKTATDAGIRCGVFSGELSSAEMRALWRKHGMRALIRIGGWYLMNGYRVGPSAGRPDADKFKSITLSSKAANQFVCPSAVYEERPFFLTNTVAWLKATLEGMDGVWGNWEPYSFVGMNACMCDTCRRKFAAFVGVSEEEMKAGWPKSLDFGGRWHDRIWAFRSLEHAKLIKTIDRHVRALTGGARSFGFVPGISWSQVSSSWRRLYGASEYRMIDYADTLAWLEPWGPYPRWIVDAPYGLKDGCTVEYFLAARDARAQVDRDFPAASRPKLMAFPQGYQPGGIAQPEWVALALDAYFFNRWECAVLYHFPQGYDARYWRAVAEATERAAAAEDFVWRGTRVDGLVSAEATAGTERLVRAPCTFLPEIREVSALQVAAYDYEGSRLVAAMNFRDRVDMAFTLKQAGLAGNYEVLRDGTLTGVRHSAAALARGVSLVAPAAKTTVFVFRRVR